MIVVIRASRITFRTQHVNTEVHGMIARIQAWASLLACQMQALQTNFLKVGVWLRSLNRTEAAL